VNNIIYITYFIQHTFYI